MSIGQRGRRDPVGGLCWWFKNGATGVHFHTKERGQIEREVEDPDGNTFWGWVEVGWLSGN